MTGKKKANDLRAQLDRLGYCGERAAKHAFSSDEIRKAVTRQPRRSGSTPSPAQDPILYRRDLPCTAPRFRMQTRRPAGPRVELEQIVKGVEVEHGHGRSFVVTTRADQVDDAGHVSHRFRELITANDSALSSRIAHVCDPAGISHEDVIFMDVESTGLNNSPLFLIGIMTWQDDGFVTHQFFARNYAEEITVIRLFLESCSSKKLLVTFNGKTFDFPYIRTRAAATGVPFTINPLHMDMLHVCRRAWRRQLPNCKLQTLETFICNRARHGDIPGSEIPDAYHEYVRTRDAWQMVDVLKHNMLDLVTMADLMNRLPPVQKER